MSSLHNYMKWQSHFRLLISMLHTCTRTYRCIQQMLYNRTFIHQADLFQSLDTPVFSGTHASDTPYIRRHTFIPLICMPLFISFSCQIFLKFYSTRRSSGRTGLAEVKSKLCEREYPMMPKQWMDSSARGGGYCFCLATHSGFCPFGVGAYR